MLRFISRTDKMSVDKSAARAPISANSPLSPFCGLQHLTRFRVDEMNLPASNTRHGFVKLALG